MICNKLEQCVNAELSEQRVSKCVNPNVRCIESSDKRSEVKCEENRKKYILENTMKNHVISYKMDGGIVVADAFVPQGTGKCDYLFVVDSPEPTAILTELKGVDVPKALEQINAVLLLYKDFFRKFSHVYGRAVVTSSTPDLKASPKYVNLARTLRQTYHGNIKIAKQQLKEKDVDLSKD